VYLEHYRLKHAPFDITPNPRFLFHSSKHREAFNHLLYGIRERKGFVQLTGEVGAGKTDLIGAFQGAHVLRTSRGDRRCRVHVSTLPVATASSAATTSLLLILTSMRSPWPTEAIRDESRLTPALGPLSPGCFVGRTSNGHAERSWKLREHGARGQQREGGSYARSDLFSCCKDL